MLKAGIYLDIENLVRNGGRGMRFHVIRDLVEAQGATVLRACAYLAVDKEREQRDHQLAAEDRHLQIVEQLEVAVAVRHEAQLHGYLR